MMLVFVGAEYEVLMGTDFNNLKIDVIVIETLQKPQNNSNPVTLLESKGYTCDQLRQNHFCSRKGFAPSRMPRDVFLKIRSQMHPKLQNFNATECKKLAETSKYTMGVLQDCSENF
jgi:hypothetical protein